MTWERDFDDLMPHVVVHEACTGQAADGTALYGAPLFVMARVESEVSKQTNVPGEEQVLYSTVFLKPAYLTGGAVVPGPRDRLTLPEGFSPRVVPVVAVKRVHDERGVHHFRLMVLTRESTLRRQITLLKPAKTRDPRTGEEVVTYIDIAVLPADVCPLPGDEVTTDFQRQAWGIASFRTDFFTDGGQVPTPEYRVRHEARLYDVLDVRQLGQREGLEFLGKVRAE